MLNGALASILCVGLGVYAVVSGTGRLWLDVLNLPLSLALAHSAATCGRDKDRKNRLKRDPSGFDALELYTTFSKEEGYRINAPATSTSFATSGRLR